MQDDPQVIGFDLDSWREVHVTDRPLEAWRAMGAGRAESLVCFFCFHGVDAPVGTRVPLRVGHSLAGRGAGHFVHPADTGPEGGHHRELVWQVSAKHLLTRWARSRHTVHSVRAELWNSGDSPRADVTVRLTDGTAVAVELPRTVLTDLAWRDRHRSHRTAGARDIWFWRPGTPVPRALLEKAVPIWSLDVFTGMVGALFGKPHQPRPVRWWDQDDLSVYASHHPPCPGDVLEPHHLRLNDLGLDRTGLVLPEPLRASLHQALQEVCGAAAQEGRLRAVGGQDQWRSTRSSPPAPRQRDPLLCRVCRQKLDPSLVRAGRHMLC
ncbi:hypothetical protein ACFWA9_04840 [Kitasatospora sp. NPDC059973]|uniref:hypothetical protein n=1 Tax=Kitasatospora sp. NPDC059973 TaxID=3347020 RepID=UPI0036ACF490